MNKTFIKLTDKEDSTNKDGINPIYINLIHVASINTNDEGWTEITFDGKLEKTLVKESIDEIREKINDEKYQQKTIIEIIEMMKSNKNISFKAES